MEGIEIDEVKLVNGWNALDEFWGTSWVNEHLLKLMNCTWMDGGGLWIRYMLGKWRELN